MLASDGLLPGGGKQAILVYVVPWSLKTCRLPGLSQHQLMVAPMAAAVEGVAEVAEVAQAAVGPPKAFPREWPR